MEDFDRLQERGLYLSAIREGLADAAAGRGIDDEELARELDEEFRPLEGHRRFPEGLGIVARVARHDAVE